MIMQIQPVNNISIKGLHFPKQPESGYITNPKIKEAIKNNTFIRRLSEKTEVLARFNDSGNNTYHLRLDVFDKESKKESVSMLYSSRIFKFKPNRETLSETEFISHIQIPETIVKTIRKGNIIDRILGRKKETVEEIKKQTEYYNFSFLNTKESNMLKGLTSEMKEKIIEAEKQIREINRNIIAEI